MLTTSFNAPKPSIHRVFDFLCTWANSGFSVTRESGINITKSIVSGLGQKEIVHFLVVVLKHFFTVYSYSTTTSVSDRDVHRPEQRMRLTLIEEANTLLQFRGSQVFPTPTWSLTRTCYLLRKRTPRTCRLASASAVSSPIFARFFATMHSYLDALFSKR